MIQEPNVTNKSSLERYAASFDKKDLRHLIDILQERLNAAAELDVNNYKKLNQNDEEFEKNINILRDGYKIRPTVKGFKGVELFGLTADVFDSPNFPEAVKGVYINSSIMLKAVHGYNVRNHIEILIDFDRPEIFDFNFMPSGSTPNSSNVKVEGADPTWVHGVFHEIQQFLGDHKPKATWLHKHSVYDILLFIIGYPIGFLACFKVSSFLPAVEVIGPFLRAAMYVYVFLFVLSGFRALFHYSRWVFPVVEFRYSKSKSIQHQVVLWTLLSGLIISVLYDVLKWLLK